MKIYIIYILLVWLLNVFLKPSKYEKNKKVFIIIAGLLLLIISCFRTDNVGVDTKQYCNIFDIVKSHTIEWSLENLRAEPGFVYLCKFLSIFSEDSQILIIVSSIIIFTSVFYFIYKNSDNCFLSILLFVLLNYFFSYMNLMRQALAISIILIGYTNFYKKNKIGWFLIFIIIASLFHQSVIVLVFLFFISQKFMYNKNFLCFTLLISLFAFIYSDALLVFFASGNQYSYYIGSRFAEGSNIAGYLNYSIAFCMLIFSYVFAKDKILEDKFFNNYLFMQSANLILLAAAINATIFGRISVYLNIYNIIYLPNVFNNIKKVSNKKIMKVVIYTSIALYWIIVSKYRPEWYGCIPYESILFK